MKDTAALQHSETAANQQAIIDTASQIRSDMLTSETDPVFSLSVASGITAADTTNWNKDTSAINELQVITISNDTIFLSSGGFAKLPTSATISLADVAAINDSVGSQLKNVVAPTDSSDAATKAYVDALETKLNSLKSLVYACYSASELLSAGMSVTEMIEAGVIADESDLLGLYHEGGVIFYIDSTTSAGLVCAVSDASSTMEWSSSDNTTGATDTAIGTGQSNTNAILSSDGSNAFAAYYCYTLTMNGYTDWFLPSKDELYEMYKKKSTIDVTATANSGSCFVNASYWSSSEVGNDGALEGYFKYNGNFNNVNKISYCYVRAVRAF